MAGLGLGREQAMEDTGYDFDKILIYIDKMADGERFFKETEDVFNHIDRLGGVYECVQKEYSKATAIEYIQKELHLADDEIYAFGDSSNDLDMIKAAGHGVIMGHHDRFWSHMQNTLQIQWRMTGFIRRWSIMD